jgi:hypothetical protein
VTGLRAPEDSAGANHDETPPLLQTSNPLKSECMLSWDLSWGEGTPTHSSIISRRNMFSLKTSGKAGVSSYKASGRGTSHPRRRMVILFSELLLFSLVCLSTVARQAYNHPTRSKWHTVKASKMVERGGKLALEVPSNNALGSPEYLHRPGIITSSLEVTFHQSPRTFPIFTLRSPPQT